MRVLKQTVNDFIADDCTTMAAALAYYTLFALPPLLLVIISVVGLAMGRAAAAGKIQAEIQSLIGAGAANQVATIIQNAAQQSSKGIIGASLGLIALLFGATSAFAQLQSSLNTIWHVQPDPRAGGVRNFLTHRILSFGMVVGVGFLLLVSLAVSAALEAIGDIIAGWLPAGFSKGVLLAAGFIA